VKAVSGDQRFLNPNNTNWWFSHPETELEVKISLDGKATTSY
jgi:hypothetical protein